MRALLVGNYGVGNLGDEALKEFFLERYSSVEWSVIAMRPEHGEYAPLPAGIRSLLAFRWLRTIRAMRRSDVLVFGGGSLFTDSESIHACVIWGLHALAAKLCGVPYALAFQGVGPFHTSLARWLTRKVVAGSAFISVRDSASFERVQDMNLHTKLVQTSDPIFLFSELEKTSDSSKKVLNIIPRKNPNDAFWQACNARVDQHWDIVNILSFEAVHPGERATLDRLSQLFPGAKVFPIMRLSQAVAPLCDSTVITQRYHGAICAVLAGVDPLIVPQKAGDKLDSLAALLRERGPVRVLSESAERAQNGAEALEQWFSSKA